jgi:hypothetical protein
MLYSLFFLYVHTHTQHVTDVAVFFVFFGAKDLLQKVVDEIDHYA